MDWAKAKSIFIYIFLFLNIFLCFNLTVIKLSSGVSAETINNAGQILKDRGIKVECEIPGDSYNTNVLTYENGVIDKVRVISRLLGSVYIPDKITDNDMPLVNGSKKLSFFSNNMLEYKDSRPDEGVRISNGSDAKKYLRKLLGEIGISANQYQTDLIKNENGGSYSLVLIEKFNNYLIFDNKVSANITNRGITYLEVKFKKVIGIEESEKKFIPAYQVLLKNFPSGSNTVVKNIDIGFTGNKYEQNTKEFYEFPVWRIRIEDGRERYFDWNGKEIFDLNNKGR